MSTLLISEDTIAKSDPFDLSSITNKIDEIGQKFLTKEGRNVIINSIKNEMEKATKKENYLTEDERILINKFISKIKNELNSAENN